MTEFLEDFTEERLRRRVERNRSQAQWLEENGGAGPSFIASLLEDADMAEKELDRRDAARRLWEATR